MKHHRKWWQSTTAAAAAAKLGSSPKKITEDGSNSELEDDPQTREPVHRAITITMEAYAMVLVTTPKQTRAS
jgi:hypothetical protein